MRTTDAPPAGWYPDPTGGTQLWWWDGRDWTDHRRAPPTPAAPGDDDPAPGDAEEEPHTPRQRRRVTPSAPSRDRTAELMAEARKVAREEIDRAVDRIATEARDATRRLEPLISQYGDRAMRWVRNAGLIVVAVVVLWIVLQAVAQTSLLNWIGDRIDNLVEAPAGVAATLVPPAG